MMDNAEFHLQSAQDVDSDSIIQFYGAMYADRTCDIRPFWTWLYRPAFLGNRIPYVVTKGNRVVAHAGVIPFRASWEGRGYTVSWLVDFGTLPEVRRQGLGQRLTEAVMQSQDICIAIGMNEMSMGAFMKCGWQAVQGTRIHYYFIRPFSHPKVVARVPEVLQRIGNAVAAPVFGLNYARHAISDSRFTVEPVSQENIAQLSSAAVTPPDTFHPVRDQDYLRWRILSSPAVKSYRIASVDGEPGLLFKMRTDKPASHHLDILWVAEATNPAKLKPLLASLFLWASRNSFSYVRYFCSHEETSSTLARSLFPIIRSPLTAYFARDPELFDRLKAATWHWELLDNDFEFTQ